MYVSIFEPLNLGQPELMNCLSPLLTSIFTASVTGSGSTVIAVWTYALCMAQDSLVTLSPLHLSATIGEPSSKINEAVDVLVAKGLLDLSHHSQYRIPSWEKIQEQLRQLRRREYIRKKTAEYRVRLKAKTSKP